MIKTILVPICHQQGADERIECAIDLANKFDAHIQALHILTPLETMVSSIHADFARSIEVYSQFQKDVELEAEKLKEKYVTKLEHAGVRFDWCQEKGDLLDHLYIYSRASDLTILSQKDDSFDDILDYTNDFIIGSGLPVLVIPKKYEKTFEANNIIVAWDGSRESAKVTHDALPLLKAANKVTVLTVSENNKEQVPGADICIHLARHGVIAEALTITEENPSDQIILNAANNIDADLIVAGAWGHKRLQEIVFGGVTKTLISNQKKALFLAH